MNCPKCGAVLEKNSKFCDSCGAQINGTEEAANTNSNPFATPNSEVQQSTANIDTKVPEDAKRGKVDPIGLIVGTLIIIVGFIRIRSAGTSISSTSFGGDFYTYAYQGIVAISEILASIEVSLGWVIVAIGAAIDVRSLRH